MSGIDIRVASRAACPGGRLPGGPHQAAFLEFLEAPQYVLKGKELCRGEDGGKRAYVLLEGWMYSYRTWQSGKRQIVDFKIRGDTLGLGSLFAGKASLPYVCLTDVAVVPLKMDLLQARLEQAPHIAASVVETLVREEIVLEEHLINLGRHTATARVAHLLLELGERLRLVNLATAEGYNSPLTQAHLAMALGLTKIHVNRVLRSLREQRLLTMWGGAVRFHDRRALIELCDFDSSYIEPAQ